MWQGPTAAVSFGPNFEKIYVFGITNLHKIAMWKREDTAKGWEKPVIIEENVRVSDRGSVTAIISNTGEVSFPCGSARSGLHTLVASDEPSSG